MTDRAERISREELTARLASATGKEPEEIREGAEEFEIESPDQADWEYIE